MQEHNWKILKHKIFTNPSSGGLFFMQELLLLSIAICKGINFF